MLADLEYPLSTEVLTVMLMSKLQYEEDSEVVEDLIQRTCNQLFGIICDQLDSEVQAKRRKSY